MLYSKTDLFPYKLLIVQQFDDLCHTAPKEVASWYLQKFQSNDSFPDCLGHSDQYVLHSDRNFNKHNIRNCRTEAPHEQREVVKDSEM